ELLSERVGGLDESTRHAVKELLAAKIHEREHERRDVADRLRAGKLDPLLEGLEALRADLAATAPARLAQTLAARTRARAGAAGRALARAARAADDGTLHRARIAVKKWRYLVELAHEPGAAPHVRGATARLEALRELQQVLGEIQDRVTLLA